MAFNFGMLAGIGMQLGAGMLAQQGASAQADMIRVGGDIAAQGALFTASGYRQSSVAVGQASAFNLEVDKINLKRRLDASSRQAQRLISRQSGQQAASGLSLGSKSFLMLKNETLDVMSRGFLHMKVDAENQKNAKIFETKIRQMNLENQARASEYQAAAEQVLAANRAAQAEYQGEVAAFQSQQRAFSSILKGFK